MIELGKKQELTVIKRVEFGVYLGEQEDAEERVLLPKKQVPEGTEIGSKLTVFVYKDSKDRLISTTNEPKLELGGLAVLKVAQVGKIGAFLDWGLEKDLLLPFREQTRRVHEGQEVLVALYIDKSSRLCATMNVYEYLELQSPYKKDDRVKGTVYEISEEFGAFVEFAPGKEGMVHISKISKERIKQVEDVLTLGDVVKVVCLGKDKMGRLSFSMKDVAE